MDFVSQDDVVGRGVFSIQSSRLLYATEDQLSERHT